jgi:hypothetical protein
LILGERFGSLEVFDINTLTITSAHYFRDGGNINDIIAIDDTNYLLATVEGLLMTSKDQLINHYFKRECVFCLCHITDSLYLVGIN